MVTKKGTGEIVTIRRPFKDNEVAPKGFVICPTCKATIKRTNLAKHQRSCMKKHELSRGKKRRNVIQEADCFEKVSAGKITPELSSVLCRLRIDDITDIIMNDSTLLQWGNDMIQGQETDQLGRYGKCFRDRLRMGAMFLKNIREEISDPNASMITVVVPENWRAITRVTSKMASCDARLKIGNMLNQIAALLRAEVNMSNLDFLAKQEAKANAQNFLGK